jgi:hypothetical protein
VELLIFLIIVGLLALIPANIAAKKGRDFALWWIYGFFLFIVALIHALMMESLEEKAVRQDAYKKLAAGYTPTKLTHVDFAADGVVDGIPYKIEPDGGIVALLEDRTIKFKKIEDLQLMLDAREKRRGSSAD